MRYSLLEKRARRLAETLTLSSVCAGRLFVIHPARLIRRIRPAALSAPPMNADSV